MRSKTTSTHISQQFGFFKSIRRISLTSFPVLSANGKTVSVILKSESDFDSSQENLEQYKARSLVSLNKKSYEIFSRDPFLLLKINQTVIDHTEWAAGRVKIKFIGHIFSGIFSATLEGENLNFTAGSLLSKVSSEASRFFEDDNTIMNTRLISSQLVSRNSKATGSQEYYWQLSPAMLNFNTNAYTSRISRLKTDNKPYDINLSACGHAVYEALVGSRLPINKSPQTAAVRSVFDILNSNDETMIDNLRYALFTSKLSDTADEVDKKFRSNYHRLT